MPMIKNTCTNCEGEGLVTSSDPHVVYFHLRLVTCNNCDGVGYFEFPVEDFGLDLPIRYDEGAW
jgi:DnaJ-class molecular chaperone